MAYTTQYGLPQNVVNYLNQQLPTADIYGGITSVPFTFDDVSAEQQIEAQASGTLTPEQLRLLYLQQQRGGGEGRDDDNNIDRTNNLGINSLSDLASLARDNMGTIVSSALFGIGPTIIGKGIKSLYDRFKDDPYGGFDTSNISPDVQTAIEKDIQREPKDYNTGGNGGSKSGGRSDPYGGGRGGLHDGE
jgi:hypothetical protein